jgi:hypothetical protein
MPEISLETDQILRLTESLHETEKRLIARHTAEIELIREIRERLNCALTRASAAPPPAGGPGVPAWPEPEPPTDRQLAERILADPTLEADVAQLEAKLAAPGDRTQTEHLAAPLPSRPGRR